VRIEIKEHYTSKSLKLILKTKSMHAPPLVILFPFIFYLFIFQNKNINKQYKIQNTQIYFHIYVKYIRLYFFFFFKKDHLKNINKPMKNSFHGLRNHGTIICSYGIINYAKRLGVKVGSFPECFHAILNRL
jgi:hypothetical protein